MAPTQFHVYPAGADPTYIGTYSFRVRSIPPDQSFSIAIGDTVTNDVPSPGAGNLEVAGAYDIYTFTGTSNQLVFFEDLGAERCCLNWDVYEPNGGRIVNDRLDTGDPGRVKLPRDGTYTIYVYPAGADPTYIGTYSFRLRSIPPDQSFSIAIGDTVTNDVPSPGAGNLETAGANDIYTFTGISNQLVYFEDLGAERCCLNWDVYEPNGGRIVNDRLDTGDPGRVKLPRDGTYTIYVYPAGADPAYIGTYSFRLRSIPPDQSFSIAIGDTVTNGVPSVGAGNLETAGANDIFTFTGMSNQLVYFEDLGAERCCLNWDVYEPNGGRIVNDRLDTGDPGRVKLPRDGTYTIYVYPAGTDPTYIGTYSFRLRSIAPDQSFPIAIGDTVSDGRPAPGAGNLETPGANDIYTFTGAANQVVYFQDLNAARCCLSWDVYAPNGSRIVNDRLDGGDPGTRTLPLDGTYTIYVYPAGADLDYTGPYSFRIWGALPVLSDQPQDQRTRAGNSPWLSVQALSPFMPLGYQWLFNGTNLPGATASILILSNAAPDQAGSYSVVVTNQYGAVTSAVATLTLDTSEFYVTSFQPIRAQSAGVSELRVQFSAPANAASFTPGDVVIHAPTGVLNSASFTITPVDVQTFSIVIPAQSVAGQYRVEIGPNITDLSGHPMTGGVFVPVYATDFEAAIGPEWSRLDTLSNAVTSRFLGELDNATATLGLTDLPPHDRVRVQWDLLVIDSWDGEGTPGPDYWGFGTSDQPLPLFEYTFHNYPATNYPQSFPGNPSVGISNFIAGSYADSIYQNLQRDFADTNSALNLGFYGRNLQGISDEGWGLDNVRVFVSTPSNGLFTANFTIDDTAPAITSQAPSGTSLEPVDHVDVTFSEAVQPSSFTTSDVQLTGPIGPIIASGVQRLSNTTYRVTFPSQRLNSAYTLIIGPNVLDVAGNPMSAAYSNQFHVLTPPLITTQPVSQIVVRNNDVTFTVVASATPPVSYQWTLHGTNLPNATNATLMLTHVEAVNAGSYQAAVTDSGGTALSSVATLTVLPTYGSFIALAQAAPTGLPPVSGDGVHIDLFNGIGGGAVPVPSLVTNRSPDGAAVSPVVDFPHPGSVITVGNAFDVFFADTTTPPEQVSGLSAENFLLRVATWLRVTRDLDLHPETPEIDLQIGVGSDDGFHLEVGTNFLGQASDRGFTYSWMDVSFEDAGLYPVTLHYAANAVGASGLELGWKTALVPAGEIIPQSALYITPSPADRLITFEEVPVGTVLSNQFASEGILFRTLGGELETVTNSPSKFVPVSAPNVYADARANPAELGAVELSFTVPGTEDSATTTYLSFYLIDAETTGATVAAFDSDGALVFTNSYHGGGAGQELVTISEQRLARVRITLGQGSDTVALDNIRFTSPVSFNHRPVVAAIPNQTIDESNRLTLTVSAADADPDQTLTFSLVSPPNGASIDASNGVFTWTPSEAQGPDVYTIIVRATDNASIPLSGTNAFTVTVNEVNLPPILTNIPPQYAGAGHTLQFTARASDADLPAQTLTFTLDPGAPAGASIDPNTGLFTWPVPPGQLPGNVSVTIRVTDDGPGGQSASQPVTLIVDNDGPRVLAMSPSGSLSNVVDHLDLTFNEAISLPNFTPSDVTFSGPVLPTVTNIALLASNVVRVEFTPAQALGDYSVRVGPNVTDFAGNPMNQNGNSANGEMPGDLFTGAFSLALPDLAVRNVTAPANASPGSLVEISWLLTNAGNATAVAPFNEAIYLTPDSTVGTESLVESFLQTNSLAPGAFIVETQTVAVPLAGLTGTLRFAVQADSDEEIGEFDESNNVAFAPNSTLVAATLSLQLSANQIREDALPPTLFVSVTRNGDVSQPLVVTLATSDATSLTTPDTVTILAGQHDAGFNLTVHPDNLVTGNKPVTITASAPGFNDDAAVLTVLDTDLPGLHLSLSASTLVEGNAVFASLARDGDPSAALEVQVTSSSATHVSTPTVVTIPAGGVETNFLVVTPDNNLIEGTRTFNVTATALGYRSSTASFDVQDNDLPAVDLVLASIDISEGAGPQATIATLHRSPITARAVMLDLESSNTNAALVPAHATIPAGQDSVSFPVAAVDNAIVDGPKQATIHGFVLDSTTGARLAEVASVDLTVEDDDGPALQIALAQGLVAEGLNPATTGTITRNTGSNGDLLVALSSSRTNEAVVPPTVTIPAGQTSAAFSVASVNDGVSDGNQRVTITAAASNYAPGNAVLTVSDVNLPDLIIMRITAPETATTESFASIGYRMVNQGLTNASTNFSTRILLSRDPVVGDDLLLGEFSFTGTIPPGQYFEQAVSVRLPQAAGTYWVVAQADVDDTVLESLEDNNVTISATPIQVGPAYVATVATDVDTAPANTMIPMYGRATVPATGVPAPEGSLVNIHIHVRDTHRVISAFTDADGNFAVAWRPLPGEAGSYQIGAAHPGDADAPAQDTFTLVGFKPLAAELDETVVEHGSVSGQVLLQNLSAVPLSGITATVVDKPANVTAVITPPTTLAGDAVAPVGYTLRALDASGPGGIVRVRFVSAEGATNEIVFNVTVQSLAPRLVVTPARLVAGMTRGAQTLVQFDVANLGGTNTGPLSVLTPALPWLSVASTNPLPSLAPNASNRVTLQLTPASTLPFGEYTGALVLSDGTASLSVPFSFRALSEQRGDLLVRAEDEFTFYAQGSPPVSNATVVVRDAVSQEVVTNGITDADGQFLAGGLPESYYEIQVDAAQHIGSRDTVLLLAGQTNSVEAFLSRETVQYHWTVVPTEIQDRTKITIETTFETVVPVPVVTIFPNLIDLAEITSDVTQIDLAITNHGLIAANNFHLNFGTHPDWQFTPLISDIGTLPARSSLVIPLTIRRLHSGGGSPAPGLASKAAPKAGGPCAIPAGGCWTLLCGVKHSYCAPINIINVGGNCGFVGGGASGGGNGSIGAPYVVGPGYAPPLVCDCDTLPKICLGGGTSFSLDGIAAKLGEMVLSKLPSFRLVKSDVSLSVNGKICTCCKDNQLSYEGEVSGKAEITIVVAAGPGFAGSLDLDAGPEWTDFSASIDALLGVELTISGSVEVKYNKKCADGEQLCVTGQAGLQAFAGAQLKAEVSAKSAATGVTYTGSIDGQLGIEGSLTAKVEGCTDSELRFEVCGQITAKAHMQGTVKAEVAGNELTATIGPNADQVIASAGQCGGSFTGFLANKAVPHTPDTNDVPLVEIVSGNQFLRPPGEVLAALQGDLPPHEGICATVRLKLEQEAVQTRDAFRATLEIDNNSGSALTDLGVDLVVKNSAGEAVTGLFGIRPPELQQISAVDGTGALGPGLSGSAIWTLIPSVDAAPTGPTQLFVGGTLRFTQDGTPVAIPLAPAPITVYPLPQLALDYFHQRDVFADDPFTDEVEPSLPYSLAVMVRNTGLGTARNLHITSAQPQIVDNEKGLLIDFKILATEVAGQNITPSLTVDFGNLAPGETAIGRWLLASTLQGLFIQYDASFESLDILGNQRLAIITNVAIHEMNHLVWATGSFDDAKPDFLVNELDDPPLDLPDTLYLSDGSVESVAVVTNGTVGGTLSSGNLSVTLNAALPPGWTYLRVLDPGTNQYRLRRVVRSDGVEILFGTNVWTTDRTFIGFGRRPIREHRLHLLDHDSPGSYTLFYQSLPSLDTTAPASFVAALPAASFAQVPLSWSGTDESGGSGLAYFDIYVSENEGPFALWLPHTSLGGAIYSGTLGSHYAFYSVATDNAGNHEAPPASPDAETAVSRVNHAPSFASLAPQVVNEGDALVTALVGE